MHSHLTLFRRTIPQQTRRSLILHTPPKPELVIGNNTALFAIVASFRQHGPKSHPKVRLIYPEFWMDNIHPNNLTLAWGQTPNGLPKIARDIFHTLHPTYPQHQPITFRHMIELRQHALAEIRQYGIPTYPGNPSIINLTDHFLIHVQQPGHMQAQTIKTPADTHFYLWYRVAERFCIAGKKQPQLTDIYQYSFNDMPKDMTIILLGNGPSILWLTKQLATPDNHRQIICIKRRADNLNVSVPGNQSADLSRLTVLNIEDVTLHAAQDDPNLMVVESHAHQREFRGLFYTAIGFTLPEHIIDMIPPSQVTSPGKWVPSRWIAPKNIPIGSLMESILKWFELTNNLQWGFELQSYHDKPHSFPQLIKNRFPLELNIDRRYFQALENKLITLDNPLSDNEVQSFLTQLYKDVYQPTTAQLCLFTKELDHLLRERFHLIQEHEPDECKP